MQIEWKPTGDDQNDLKAEPVAGDMLRVERMRKGLWWYCCYIGKDRFDDDPASQTTMKKAKDACEALYKKHKNAV